jgi:mono/diheme cytochrome c family protein
VALAVLLLTNGTVRGQRNAANPTAGLPTNRQTPVDAAAAVRGKAIWAAQCITCHGTQARGTDSGPNLIRSETANYDRYAARAGDVLGPFLKKGHPTQSGKQSSAFTDAEIGDLANFIRERINYTMRGSPDYIVRPENLLTGNAKTGASNFREFGCPTCHNAKEHNLDGIATRINNPERLQAMVLYPGGAGREGRAGRGGTTAADGNPPGPQPPNPLAERVTIQSSKGAAHDVQTMTGTLVEQDAFFLTYSDPDGTLHTVRKTPEMKIATVNPMQRHVDFADQITDKEMHDLTAYLWSLK